MALKEIRNLDNMQEIDHDNFGRLVRLKTDIFDTVVYVDNNDDLYVLSDMQSGDWPTCIEDMVNYTFYTLEEALKREENSR